MGEQSGSPRPMRVFRPRTDAERVRVKYEQGMSLIRISRQTQIALETVRKIAEGIDEEIIDRIANSSEAEKARHVAYLDAVAEESFIAYQRSVRSARESTLPDARGIGNPRLLNVGIAAKRDSRKIQGLDAPTRNISLEIKSKAMTNPEALARIKGNARARRAMLEFEAALTELDDVIDIEEVVEE